MRAPDVRTTRSRPSSNAAASARESGSGSYLWMAFVGMRPSSEVEGTAITLTPRRASERATVNATRGAVPTTSATSDFEALRKLALSINT